MKLNEYQQKFPMKYYEFKYDLEMFPDAWCYVVYSARGKGKTYSALLEAYKQNIPILYMKRTNEDVAFITREQTDGLDTSPYAPLNRDHLIEVYGRSIDKGVGGFWHYEDGEPSGLPVSYALSLNAVKRVKGFDASRCDWIILDEFIPQIGERVLRSEGELLLDLYMTVARDRDKRGKPPLKLILFANAEDISTPITNTLEILDIMADLNASGNTHFYDEDRGILLHHITNDEIPMTEKEKNGIYKAMQNTAWGQKSFYGEFAKNDFSNVTPKSLKRFRGYIHLHYKMHDYYIYINDNAEMYMCESRTKCELEFDLNRENEQKAFYMYQIDLRSACIDERLKFQKYSMYDLIINYTKIFNLR